MKVRRTQVNCKYRWKKRKNWVEANRSYKTVGTIQRIYIPRRERKEIITGDI